MLSLHQLRCFLSAYEHGSFTTAAADLGMAQPSLSEQIRLLERSVGTPLFGRVGRGVVATEAGHALRPHAERTLEAADAARAAVAEVTALESGTVRFGMFGTARLYLGAGLVGDVLRRHPGVRVELVGQNSVAVQDELRAGRLEAAMIAIPVTDDAMTVTPVARDELVYISADPERLVRPVSARVLAEAPLVLSEVSWRDSDSGRRMLAAMVQRTGRTLRPRIEVEDLETAIELVQAGFADSVVPVGALAAVQHTLAPDVGHVSLRPRLHDTLAVVHRRGAVLSRATRLVIELATARVRQVTEPL